MAQPSVMQPLCASRQFFDAVYRMHHISQRQCSYSTAIRITTRSRVKRITPGVIGRQASSSGFLPGLSVRKSVRDSRKGNEDPAQAKISPPSAGSKKEALLAVDHILSTESIIRDQEAVAAMRSLRDAVKHLHSTSKMTTTSPIDRVLDDEQPSSSKMPNDPEAPSISPEARLFGEKAYALIKHRPLFISLPLLQEYVALQLSLGQASTLPEIFWLYAHKPLPRRSTSHTVNYVPAWPNSPKAAVPKELADQALNHAIRTRDLPLAQEIVDTTVATTAHRWQRLIRRAGLPLGALALSPVGAYLLASRMASNMPNLEPKHATWTVFALMCAYLGWTSVLGVVAATTDNRQMQRVSWQLGTMLRERWLREDERAAIDRVACAWGFKDRRRRGEETGRTWAAMHEWAGTRGMILDKVSLMDDMQ